MSPSAVDLDRLLAELTPETRDQLRASAPVHLLDQFDKATDDATTYMRVAGAWLNAPVTAHDVAGLPEWVRLSLLDTWLRYLAGTGSTCMHSPNPHTPQPLFAPAWRPGLVTCAACMHLHRLVGAADRTCDRCGYVVAGVDVGEGIHVCQIQYGPLAYSYGLCPGCYADQNTNQGETTP